MENKKIDSCVFKRDWRFYKTCNECQTKNKCNRPDKFNWFERIIEQISVWLYRVRIKIRLSRMFKGVTKRDVKRAHYQIKNAQKQIDNKLNNNH